MISILRLAVLSLLLTVLFITGVSAGEITGVTAGTGIQLRDRPVNGTVIKRLNAGIRVRIEKESEEKDGLKWCKAVSENLSINGFVRSDFIDRNGISALEIKEGTVYPTAYDDVKIKDRPGNTGRVLCSLPYGTVCTIRSSAIYDDDGGYYWFNVAFEGVNSVSEGYIRYDYLSTGDFANELRGQGFPESYITPLVTVHSLYPGWIFKAYDPAPDMTFDKCVDAETPISVMESSAGVSSLSGLKSLTGGLDGKEFETLLNGSTAGDRAFIMQGNNEADICWSAATRATVAYRMDPRNFMVTDSGSLNTSFFMFLSGTDTEGTTEAGVREILSTTSMTGSIPGEGTSYSSAVYDKSVAKGVNPYLIAARMRQEHGNPAGDDLINGKGYKGEYAGYYNYFNIQANGDNPVLNGLKYAKEKGWDTRTRSINGGIDFLSDNYFMSPLHKQDTLYKQRFFFKDGTYCHQYMTSIYAPHNEAKNVYLGYKTDTSAFSKGVFLIPVYRDMPEKPCPQD